MALIKCPECNREISEFAKTCPSCGYKIKCPKQKKRNKVILGIILLVTTVCIGVTVIYSINKRNQALEKLDKEIIEFTEYPQRPRSYQEVSHLIRYDCYCEAYSDNPIYYQWILSKEGFISIRTELMKGQMNNIPFEQSGIYLEWDTYFKHQFKKK